MSIQLRLRIGGAALHLLAFGVEVLHERLGQPPASLPWTLRRRGSCARRRRSPRSRRGAALGARGRRPRPRRRRRPLRRRRRRPPVATQAGRRRWGRRGPRDLQRLRHGLLDGCYVHAGVCLLLCPSVQPLPKRRDVQHLLGIHVRRNPGRHLREASLQHRASPEVLVAARGRNEVLQGDEPQPRLGRDRRRRHRPRLRHGGLCLGGAAGRRGLRA
mmetsp:Transcript_103756/g.289047  ORF Transcript_103756/g.289047 Transcript_103756/m.289047 type:complete len:216 (+) Transcript_103756:115-762(+)